MWEVTEDNITSTGEGFGWSKALWRADSGCYDKAGSQQQQGWVCINCISQQMALEGEY